MRRASRARRGHDRSAGRARPKRWTKRCLGARAANAVSKSPRANASKLRRTISTFCRDIAFAPAHAIVPPPTGRGPALVAHSAGGRKGRWFKSSRPDHHLEVRISAHMAKPAPVSTEFAPMRGGSQDFPTHISDARAPGASGFSFSAVRQGQRPYSWSPRQMRQFFTHTAARRACSARRTRAQPSPVAVRFFTPQAPSCETIQVLLERDHVRLAALPLSVWFWHRLEQYWAAAFLPAGISPPQTEQARSGSGTRSNQRVCGNERPLGRGGRQPVGNSAPTSTGAVRGRPAICRGRSGRPC